MRNFRRYCFSDQSICVRVIGGKQGKGRDGDLMALRSVDDGKILTAPLQLFATLEGFRYDVPASR
jgi:hypothetical protein